MSVMTVTGEISEEELGIVLPHEHLFLDLTNQFTEPAEEVKQKISRQKVDCSHWELLNRDPYAIKDNLIIEDVEYILEEVNFFKKAGGKTIVDCTSIGIKRNVDKLKLLSEKSGMNIIAGCGYYTHDTHPDEIKKMPVDAIAEKMLAEFTDGIDGTDIKPGIIGEIGTSDPLHPNEEKCLLAAAKVHDKTNCAIQVHTYPWGKNGIGIVELLIKNNVLPEKIIICHTDVPLDKDYILQLLAKGVFVEFDNFGKEFDLESSASGFVQGGFCKDKERVGAIKEIIENNYTEQILITNDICLKCLLCKFGGNGYAHILNNIVPKMRETGISDDAIRLILKDNPGRMLVC